MTTLRTHFTFRIGFDNAEDSRPVSLRCPSRGSRSTVLIAAEQAVSISG
jgi:hypothetical protein